MDFTIRLELKDDRTMKFLFDSHYPRFLSFVHSMVKDREAASDIVQDVFVKMWKLSLSFADENEFRAYSYFSLKNASFNYLRDYVKSVDLSDVYDALSNDKTVDYLMIEKEMQSMVTDAISHLPEVRRNIILLRLEGKSYIEISEELSLSLNTIKTHKKLAYKDLKDTLKSEDFTLILNLIIK